MIESGTVVWLKSGGPAMTVSYTSDRKAYCIWLLDGEVRQFEYYKDSLTTEDPN